MKAKVTIINKLGIHARPLSKWMQVVNKYDAEIEVSKKDKKYNGKSMISLMQMGAVKGDELLIETRGKDEIELLNKLVELTKCGFGE
ncbi:HPr family phosphocarrier protein [Wukongibacter sp. M2B1]|uniref:HPr family phosphocarrier protein n=1 Tax=Wukongibacter sp. M2B1 TaxID=3088895 RepID=UPI003D7C1321